MMSQNVFEWIFKERRPENDCDLQANLITDEREQCLIFHISSNLR